MMLKSLFRRKGKAPPAGEIDRVLEGEGRRLLQVDSETGIRWRDLQNSLELSRDRPLRVGERFGFRLRPAIALGLAAAALVVGVIFLLIPATGILNYSTGRGQISRILLADSSEVLLNHTSQLAVDIAPGRGGREVRLQGEAFFRVRRTGKPFRVTTEAGIVQVLGTEFNVRIREGRMEVAVVEGRVAVGTGGDMTNSVTLSAGTMTTCEKGSRPSAPERILFADYPGWIHHELLFQRTRLEQVLNEIESQFDILVRVDRPALLRETVTGSLDSRSAESAVAALATLTGCKYRHEPNGFTLY